MATTTNDTDSALSGGLLVILGIIVALGIGYAFYHYNTVRSPDLTINLPATPSTPATPTPAPAPATVPSTGE